MKENTDFSLSRKLYILNSKLKLFFALREIRLDGQYNSCQIFILFLRYTLYSNISINTMHSIST